MPPSSPSLSDWIDRKIKSPFFLGLTWAIAAFLISEGCYQLSNQLFDEMPQVSDVLYSVSEKVSFPAPYVYNALARQRTQLALTQYLSDHPGAKEFSFLNGTLENSDIDEVWDISSRLYDEGYDTDIPMAEEYAIYIGSCAFTGAVIALISFLVFRRRPGVIDRD